MKKSFDYFLAYIAIASFILALFHESRVIALFIIASSVIIPIVLIFFKNRHEGMLLGKKVDSVVDKGEVFQMKTNPVHHEEEIRNRGFCLSKVNEVFTIENNNLSADIYYKGHYRGEGSAYKR